MIWNLLRPLVPAVSNLVPGWAALKMWLRLAAAAALVVAGMVLGAWAHSWGEARRIAKERRDAIMLANAKAEAGALKAAIDQQVRTLELRRQALERSEAEIEQLRKELEEARNASRNPDDIVVPPGDAWLQPGRR